MLKRIRALLGGARRPPAKPEPSNTPVASQAPDAGPASAVVHRGPSVVHRPIPRVDLDPDALKIVERLTRFDHSAYLVGGCVRDLLLERKPKDFDIGTSATPRQVKRMFRNSRIIGRRFRLAHIYFQNGKIIEVATFRALDGDDGEMGEVGDAEEQDRDLMIRDDNVFGTAQEDALRRDFTINALFYDVNNETVLDHAEGLRDLRAKLIRTIGDPEIRFREDPIRSLRALKFAARLGFEIEPATLAALSKTRHEIAKAAAPRVLEELNRFCRGGAARRSFELMRETEVLPVVLPEIARDYERDAWAWSLLGHLLGQMDQRRFPEAREIRTGEILAALLLPLLVRRLGWSRDGTAEPPRGIKAQDVADERLRPIALRLRISKREQEHCRQIMATLHRMVPTQGLRAHAKRALLHRDCFPDALGLLEALASELRGAFATALEFWRNEHSPGAAAAPHRGSREAVAAPPEKGRRAGRGRRRSRRGGDAPDAPVRAAVPPAAPPARPEKRTDLPPPWDDAYFFAALPSVPDGEGVEVRDGAPGEAGDGFVRPRYHEPEREADAETEAETEEPLDASAADGPKPKRRRRRRRRRKAGSPPESGDDAASAGEDSGDAGPASATSGD